MFCFNGLEFGQRSRSNLAHIHRLPRRGEHARVQARLCLRGLLGGGLAAVTAVDVDQGERRRDEPRLDAEVQGRITAETGGVVHLQQGSRGELGSTGRTCLMAPYLDEPRSQLLVDHDVQPKQLEAREAGVVIRR